MAAFVEHLRELGFADVVAEVDPTASPRLRLYVAMAEALSQIRLESDAPATP